MHFGWHKWPELPEVRQLMETENLKDLAAVEAWFNRRMAGTINRLGFKTGGWDEIAARGLPAGQRKDYPSFKQRLKPQLAWLTAKGIGFFDPFLISPDVTDSGARTETLDQPEP